MGLDSELAGLTIIDILPIFISVLALGISAFGLGWTVFRDVRKPRFRVQITKNVIVRKGAEPSEPFILLEAVNIGPLPNRSGLVFTRKGWWNRTFQFGPESTAYLMTDYAHQATSPQAKRDSMIEVGDSISHAFPINEKCFLKEPWAQIGMADGYGRLHWAPKKDLEKLWSQYLEAFAR